MKQSSLQPVIAHLTAWRAAVVERLKAGDDAALNLKLATDAAIHWLEICEKQHLQPEFEAIRLPTPDDHEPLGEYRIMWDHETEDRTSWLEVARASPDDLLLRHSP